MWKSNANGVDINRNFPTGWGLAETKKPCNSYAYYEGITPLSEVETVILEQLLMENKFDCYLAYHMRGNIIMFLLLDDSVKNLILLNIQIFIFMEQNMILMRAL